MADNHTAAQDPKRKHLRAKELRQKLKQLFDSKLEDGALRRELETLTQERAFPGLTWFWGPQLYQKNRAVFRPFILSHFSTWLAESNWRFKTVAWKGEVAKKLDPWLEEVDKADDVELFRRLYSWKHQTSSWGGIDKAEWRRELSSRFEAASPARKRIVLQKLDLWPDLDEKTALELHGIDAKAATPFILRHLPAPRPGKRQLWKGLFDAVVSAEGAEPAYRLYRRQIGVKEWQREVLELAEQESDAEKLCSELERRHPEGWVGDLSETFFRLAEKRSQDVFPYLERHLRAIFSGWRQPRGYKKLLALAEERQWWDLWSGLIRTCAKPNDFNAEIRKLLDNGTRPGPSVEQRLLQLTGVSREWNFGPFGLAQVQQLDDKTAIALYDRFPALVRGPFKLNVSSTWIAELKQFTARVIEADDEPLIDFLASRAVTRDLTHGHYRQTAETLSNHYEALAEDDAEFSRRAIAVLAQVPAYSLWAYNAVIRSNRLARLFYERSADKYLSLPAALRDLLEAPEIHSQALGFRVLGLDDERARQAAAENLDLLLASVLRPLHRQTRWLAFRALDNAATSPELAATIQRRAREALDLPDERYPKEQLIGLIGGLLYRWPELRQPSEQPLVYRTSPGLSELGRSELGTAP